MDGDADAITCDAITWDAITRDAVTHANAITCMA
jgi:hypothetical protein